MRGYGTHCTGADPDDVPGTITLDPNNSTVPTPTRTSTAPTGRPPPPSYVPLSASSSALSQLSVDGANRDITTHVSATGMATGTGALAPTGGASAAMRIEAVWTLWALAAGVTVLF
ncbi:unnamed protein product [Cutaneotrichosporon oleaginosum]